MYKILETYLKENCLYTKDDIVNIIKKVKPSLSPSSYGWIIYQLKNNGEIKRIGKSTYIKSKKLEQYKSRALSKEAARCLASLKKAFPNSELIVFETSCLNEWLNELIAHSTIVVEMRSDLLESAFFLLSKNNESHVLLKPGKDEFSHYWSDDSVIIEPLHSRAPLEKKGNGICLEKLIVDLLSDKFLGYFFSRSELPEIYEEMFEQYAIDADRLFTYAKRRRVLSALLPLLPEGISKRGEKKC
jgi:hypothetical protein